MLFDDMTLEEVRALDRRDSLEEGIGIGREEERERIINNLINIHGFSPQDAEKLVSEA